jgi:predicted nucleic acid-binding protein
LVGTLKVQLYYNAEIIKEYTRVLHYPKLKITEHQIDSILNLITEHGITMEAKKSTIEMIDEDDRIFYDTAKHSGSILVTGNLKHYPKEASILAPTEFLAKYA